MITTFTGSNSFLLQADLQKMVTNFVAEHGAMALERLEGEEVTLDRIGETVQSLPFLAAKKLVVLQQPSLQKDFTEKAADMLADVPETTDVVIVEPKLDKRSSYYKWLKKSPNFQEFNELDERGLAKWATEYAKGQGAQLSLGDATYLVDRIGANQRRLGNELDKLALANAKLTRPIINDLTEATPQSKIFDLLDAAFSGQQRRAIKLYHEQRTLKVEPQEIIAMIGWQLRQVALAKTAGRKHDMVREAKVSPYGASKAQRIANRLTLAQLKQLVQDLTQLDMRSKQQPIDLDEALQNYIINLT